MTTPRSTKREALRRLTEAARPFGLRVEQTPHSALPDLVFLRPADGSEVARLRFFADDAAGPYFQSVYPPSVSAEEEAEVDEYLGRMVAPVVADVFSYMLWISLCVPQPEN